MFYVKTLKNRLKKFFFYKSVQEAIAFNAQCQL